MAAVQVTGVDHIVLRVRDPVASVEWYGNKLGLPPVRLEEYKAGKLLWGVCLAHDKVLQGGRML